MGAIPTPRRRLRLALLAGLALMAPACSQDGHFTVLGYTTAPNYDTSIKTVRVPIFENKSYRRGLEFQLTQAVAAEIERVTPYKVVQCGDADAELTGVIVSYTKNVLFPNPLNEAREAETPLLVQVTFRNLRTGEVLSRPSRRPGVPSEEFPQPPTPFQTPGLNPPVVTPPTVPGEVADPDSAILPPQPPEPGPKAIPPPANVRSVALLVPELGYSVGTAQAQAVQRMAVQIVSEMEKGW
jgi:hypothetical protein